MAARENSLPPDAEQQLNRLSTVGLARFGLRRDPPRPPADRQPGYLDLFDSETLFYDAFRGADPCDVILIGPPLLNCASLLDSLAFCLPGKSGLIPWRYAPGSSGFTPNFKIRLSHPALAGADRLQMSAAGRQIDIQIQPNGCSRFAGRRMILTLSKDNPLSWISDWVTFNTRIHRADAVLVYDNGSSAYGIAALENLLSAIPGIAAALVVPWPFPYGPNVGPRKIQDSFFCQPGALEHARWRYCGAAQGVLNNDIDELTVPPPGDSLFNFLERSGKAAIVYPGLWADKCAARPAAKSATPGVLRHSDFIYSQRWRLIPGRFRPARWLLRTKWAVWPALCPGDADWGVHDIYCVSPESAARETSWKLRTSEILYRHLRLMSAKPARQRMPRSAALTAVFDRPLARCLAAAFADHPRKSAMARGIERLMWIFRNVRRR
jgi:hypothetical protein